MIAYAETGVWSKVITDGVGPSPRFSIAGDCIDARSGGILAFIGGCNDNLEALDDMYYLDTGCLPPFLFGSCKKNCFCLVHVKRTAFYQTLNS